MKLTVLLLVCAMLFSACSESTAPEDNAEKVSVQSLSSTLGFDWFSAEMTKYQPDAAKVLELQGKYNPATDAVYLYVNPSCGCKGTQKLFPHTMRVLNDAGIKEPRVEIYSMRSATDKHPYMSFMPVKRLPTIYIVRNGAVVGSFSEQPDDVVLEDMLLSYFK